MARTTTVAGEKMVHGFIVAVAGVTGQRCGVVIEDRSLPGGCAMANITLRSGNDVRCRFVADMAAAARPQHFVMVCTSHCRPGTGPR